MAKKEFRNLLVLAWIDWNVLAWRNRSVTDESRLEVRPKVSARQAVLVWRPLAKKSTINQRKEHNAEKYIQWFTTLSLTIRVYLHSFIAVAVSKICEISQNSPKIRTYNSSKPSKVIDLSVNRKRYATSS